MLKRGNVWTRALVIVLIISLVGSFAVAQSKSEKNDSGKEISANDDVKEVFSEEKEKFKEDISSRIKSVAGEDVDNESRKYVETFVSQRGIEPGQINNVSKIDFDSLPKEVEIENVDEANLAIYGVNYTEDEKENQIFVITYSVNELKGQGDLIVAQDKRALLNFGSEGEMSGEGGFLKTATGVEGSLESGYVMIREGSITAVSTSLQVLDGVKEDNIEIVVYKNGEEISFGNSFEVEQGVNKDYDIQSKGIVTFVPGDVISAYARSSGKTTWKSVITIVEVTTTN